MARSITQNPLLLITLIVGLFAAAIYLNGYVGSQRVTIAESYSDEDLDLQGKRLKGYALGFEGLIADWYWMRSLQYVGDKVEKSDQETIDIENLRSLNPRLLYPLLDNATDLDPKFISAYSYGAIVLPAIDKDQAIKLTEKGIANNPDEWRLYQYLGYIHWKMKNYATAAEVYERGSQLSGAPPFLKMMAGMMRSEGGSRDTGRIIYEQMVKDLDDPDMRRVVELRLNWLDSLDERDLLNSALANFKEKNGRCARSWGELTPTLNATPSKIDLHVDRNGQIVDPTGIPYDLDATACHANLNRSSLIPKD
jgi:tetratricopeptide (TPR) repeat protein